MVRKNELFTQRYQRSTLASERHIHGTKVANRVDPGGCSDPRSTADLHCKAFVRRMKDGVPVGTDHIHDLFAQHFRTSFTDRIADLPMQTSKVQCGTGHYSDQLVAHSFGVWYGPRLANAVGPLPFVLGKFTPSEIHSVQ